MMLRPAALPIFTTLLLSMALGGAVGGCGREQAAPARAPEPLRVVATTYAMADIVRVVGGDYVRPEWWVESGQSLAELRENPDRRLQLNSVALVVTRGQVDPWTLAGAGNAYQDRRILRVDVLPAARAHDPSHYIWLDPAVARELADELAARLGALDSLHSEQFRANAANFNREIDRLTKQSSSTIMRAGGGGPFVALDRGFVPLGERFGLEDVRIQRVDLREPTTFNVRQLRQAIEDAGGGAVFANTETPPALLRDWESRLGYPVLALESLGSSGQTGRSTYLEILRYNLAQLQKGVALAKPRVAATTGPVPLGAVTPEPPRYSELPPAETNPTTAEAAATRPAHPVVPPRYVRPPAEPLRLKLPLPSTQPTTGPAPLIPTLPFRSVPAK
jgi:ABC-type Zn uptake system ZnuABC Zn-binding protein ZnuA